MKTSGADAPVFIAHIVAPKTRRRALAKPALSQKSLPLDEGGESGGPEGLEPTRFGDWERKGRCIDF